MNEGYIHSIQTMGLLDGPGIRVVVFFQGCPLRCGFCHNPDTWNVKSNLKMSAIDLVNQIRAYRPYIENGGGVTFSGGEPLLQSKFLLEVLKLCKKAGIHTCLDTSGNGYDEKLIKDILKYTDLILLDIKAMNNENYKKITKNNINKFEKFLSLIEEQNKKLWIRQVIVPGINDNREYILELKKYISKIKNVEKVELLPYSILGVEKYKELKIDYPLNDVQPMDKYKCDELQKLLEH